MASRALRLWTHMLLISAVLLHDTTSAYTLLSNSTLQTLPAPGDDFDIHTGALLAPLLSPRVPGTPGSLAAQQHLAGFFAQHLPKWRIEYQNSTSKTPATGETEVPFVNLIMTRDPPWTKPGEVGRLNLVAHYDSKIVPEGFVGATDSAAPCAMILHAARSVDEALTRKWTTMEAGETGDDLGEEDEQGLQIIFLDGEEAFESWTDQDSLYGARSLAETWEHTAHPAKSTYHTPLHAISLFLLLDLLGAPNPFVRSYFSTTHWAYSSLSALETRLRAQSILRSKPSHPFLPDAANKAVGAFGNYIQDDHIPFMARGVDILHLIPIPFPRVWHTMDDDGEHLDTDTTNDWAVLVTAFVAEWLDLEEYFVPPAVLPLHARTGTGEVEGVAAGKTEL